MTEGFLSTAHWQLTAKFIFNKTPITSVMGVDNLIFYGFVIDIPLSVVSIMQFAIEQIVFKLNIFFPSYLYFSAPKIHVI